MKRLLLAAAVSVIGLAPIATAHSVRKATEPVKVLTLQLTDYHRQMQTLSNMQYDIAGVDIVNKTVDLIVSRQEAEMLSIYHGLQAVDVKEIDITIAPDQNYTNPAELTAFVQRIANEYPHIVALRSIGKSHENRDIWAMKITDNPENRELDEPAVLFNSMHHSRELMTTEVAMDIITQLVEGYETDTEIANWVDTTEIWVVPMLNPDGNNKVWNGDSMWRKNAYNGYGVDINRNYPYGWNSCGGSSGYTWSDTYRGPTAGSEPETKALMALIENTEPVFDISYHSYSELVIYPFGCNGERTPTREIVEGIGRDLASKLVRDSGSGTYDPGTPWELLYSVDGGDIDWMYNEYHVVPYVIEINGRSQGFQPSYSRWHAPTMEKMRPGWKFMLDRVHESGIRGVVTDRTGRTEPETMMTITSLNKEAAFDPVTWQVKYDGTYHVVLNPGMYKFQFALGGNVVEQEVTIGDNLTELDIQL